MVSSSVDRFIERESLVGSLLETSVDFTAAQIALGGPGGFGKTTLAIQTCHDARVTEKFPDILWVETGEQCTTARLVQLVADLCAHLDGTRPALEDPEQAGFQLAQMLAERRVLLVIDNVWAASDLAPFLLGGPNCVRLVTTRNLRVCPRPARIMRLGPMAVEEIRELLNRSGPPDFATTQTRRLAELCGGWPLLASVVGSSVGHDIAAGATAARAVSQAEDALLVGGPHAFDVWDADQRDNAIGRAITSSLSSLEDHVTVAGGSALRERYLDLLIFPAATPIPLSVLSTWWGREHGWTASAVRHFCRTIADRSLVGAYLADSEEIVLHDVFRSCLRHLARRDVAELHKSLIDSLRADAAGDWASLDLKYRYAWLYLSYHLGEAGLDEELIEILADPDYVVAKVCAFGQEPLAADQVALRVAESHSQAGSLAGVATAKALVDAAYLVSGLEHRHDVAATLLVSVARNVTGPSEAAERLRSIAAEGDGGLDMRWVASHNFIGDGHIGAITSVAVGAGRIVSCGEDGTVRMWERQSHRLIRTLRGHRGWVYSVATSAGADLIASAGDDGVIRLWRATTGRAAGVLVSHTRRIRSLAFDSTGRRLVSGAEDGEVIVWETDSAARVGNMSTPGCPIWSVSISPNDTLIAAAGEDESVRLYELDSGRLVDQRAAHQDWVRSVAFAADAPLLVSGSGDETVRLWSVANSQLTPLRATSTGSRVRCVVAAGQADLVMAAGEDAVVRTITADGLARAAPMPANVDWVRSVALTPEFDVVAGCEDGALRVVTANAQVLELAAGRDTIWSTAFADDGRLALLGRSDGMIEANSTASNEPFRSLRAGTGRVWSVHSEADFVAAACGDGLVRLLKLADQDWSLTLNQNAERSWAVAVAPSGSCVAASSDRGTLRVWDLPSGEQRWEQMAHAGRIRTVAFDDAGGILVTGGGDGSVRVWQTSTGEQLGEVPSPGSWVRAVSLDRDGTKIIVGYGSGDVAVHDLTTDQPVAHLFGHHGRVLMADFTSEPDRVVTAAADGTARLWSLSQQRQLAEVRIDASLQCAGFSRRTGNVLAGSSAGVVAINVAG